MSRINELFKGLMFLHGHFTRPEDLDPGFAPLGNRAASARWFAGNPGDGAKADAPADDGQPLSLLAHLQFLGGRPMTAGHNGDVEEPFPQPTPAAKRKAQKARSAMSLRRAAAAAACATALSPFR